MLRVLIADDEDLIRQLMKRLINWESAGFEIVAEAGNGFEAYDRIIELDPDIAVVDIRMPGFDGLSLVRKCREMNRTTQFILVSGYKEFEYAHEALTLGVQHYILKPIRKDELSQNLTQLRDTILAAAESQESHLRMKTTMEHARTRVRNQFMKDTVFFWSDTSAYELEQVNQNFGFSFQVGNFAFLLCKQARCAMQTTPRWDAVLAACAELFAPLCYDWESYTDGPILYILLNYQPGREDMIRLAANDLFQKLPLALGLSDMRDFTLSSGFPVQNVSMLKSALESAQNALNYRFFYGCGRCFCTRENVPPIAVSSVISKSDEQELIRCFDVNDKESIKTWLFSMLERARIYRHYPNIISLLSIYLVDLFLKNVKNLSRCETTSLEDESVYKKLLNSDTFEELTAILNSIVDDWYYVDETVENAYVRFAKQYIDDHYRSDLRLSKIAEAGNVNPAYLSRIFKEETGETFSDYLTKFRIQKAKTLLYNINTNITEVAEQVGYCDIKYFSKTFKKMVGITPKDFRNLHAR